MDTEARRQAAIDAGRPEWADLPASRAGAKAAGATQYLTGTACKRGHRVPRWTASCDCVECDRVKQGQWMRGYHQRAEVKERAKAQSRAPEAVSKRKSYYARPDVQERSKQWRQSNRDVVNEATARRHASKLKATPSWLTEDHRKAMQAIYAATDGGSQVDHVVPLQHPHVCGLHVPWNLQVLTAAANRTKSNKFDGGW